MLLQYTDLHLSIYSANHGIGTVIEDVALVCSFLVLPTVEFLKVLFRFFIFWINELLLIIFLMSEACA